MLVSRQDERLLECHCIGSGATELIHVGQAVLGLGGGLNYFFTTVCNYPTLAECSKVAAFNAANKLALVRQATGSAALDISAPMTDTTSPMPSLWHQHRRPYPAARAEHTPTQPWLGRLYPHAKPEAFVVIDNTTWTVVNDDNFGVVDVDGVLSEKLLLATGAVDQNEIRFVQVAPLPRP